MSIAKDIRAYIAEQFMTTKRKDFSMTDDMVFHIIYGQATEESKRALIALLNTVTGEETPVRDIKILNPIDYRKREDSKQVEFDIRLETDSGDLFDVEMEKHPDRYFRNRCVLYITKLCDKSLDKGKDYDIMLSTAIERKCRADEQHMPAEETKGEMRRVTMVSFAGENFLSDTESYHTEFSIRDETGRSELSDRMRFHVIEIDKVDRTKPVAEMTGLEKVALYFRYANDPSSEELISQLIDSGEEAIILAENMFRELTADEKAYEKILARQKFLWRYGSGLSAAREEGLEQGKAAEKLEMVRAMKSEGIDTATIVRVSGLSIDEIEKL